MHKLIFAISMSFAGIVEAEPITIAALGDSLTQGYGLKDGQGLVPQLQQWLDAKGAEVTLINAGVSGDTSAGGLSRVAWTLTPDVDAMIVALGGNDLLRGIAPEVTRANLKSVLKVAQEADVDVLLVGMQAPGNYGPEYKAAFDRLYPDLAQSYNTLFLESFFAGMPGKSLSEVSAYMQADGIHPNSDGVALIVEAFGPAVLELIERAKE